MKQPEEPETTSWITPKARIRQSGMDGKGLFAIAAIEKDETVVIWKGGYVNGQQAETARCAGRIVMQWDDDLLVSRIAGTISAITSIIPVTRTCGCKMRSRW